MRSGSVPLRLRSKWPPSVLPRLALGTAPKGNPGLIQLDEEQREAAQALIAERRVQLDGPPGSGKTHIAAGLAMVFAIAGYRVLYLCPRHPLAEWMKWNIEMYGVAVKTIGGHMRDVLERAGCASLKRQGYDDPDFFQAARGAVIDGSYDLVVGDEWQATSAQEQGFVRAVAGDSSFVEVQDSSRDFRYSPPREIEAIAKVQVTGSFRLDGIHRALARGPAGLEKWTGSTDWTEGVVASELHEGRLLRNGLQEAVDGFLRAGFRADEIGVVSCMPRSGNASIELSMQVLRPPGRLLGGPGASLGLTVDGGAYWLGLERAAIVVTELPVSLNHRDARLWNAVTRATKAVHVLLDQGEPSDEGLSPSSALCTAAQDGARPNANEPPPPDERQE